MITEYIGLRLVVSNMFNKRIRRSFIDIFRKKPRFRLYDVVSDMSYYRTKDCIVASQEAMDVLVKSIKNATTN
jgi:hypothetical protein